LGSSLALVTAALLKAGSSNNRVDGVFSFGGPRVGDSDWAAVYNSLGLGDNTLRFVYYKDIVPMMPPASTGYTHVGRSIILPLDGSSCLEEGKDEYDVCAVDDSFWNFVSATSDNFLCFSVATPVSSRTYRCCVITDRQK